MVFGKNGCAKCQTTKNKLGHFLAQWEMEKQVDFVFQDLETVDGRAEGAFYDVNDIPVTIVEKEGRQVARWDGEIPNSQAVKLVLHEGAHAAAH